MSTKQPTATRSLERISRDVDFDDEAAAHRYLQQQLADGFLPASPWAGVVPTHRYHENGETTYWTVHVAKQILDGKTIPAYHEGDRVTIFWGGDGEKIAGAVTEVRGNRLTIALDGGGEYGCLDYEATHIDG